MKNHELTKIYSAAEPVSSDVMEATPERMIPELYGLVMAGGDSARMGVDKGLLDYHGIPQQDYVAQLLEPFVSEVFISRRKGQEAKTDLTVLEDTYSGLGPFGGLLSAFQYKASCAWFVVACDFPLLDPQALGQLVEARDPTAYATCFLDEKSLMPEPWVTILEPKIYPILLEYHKKGRSSLRGILVDYNVPVIRATDTDVLMNANTPEEAERLKKIISEKHL